jgi:hypothetical protein
MHGLLILAGIAGTALASYLTTRRQLQLEKRQTAIEYQQENIINRLTHVEDAVEESAGLMATKTIERDKKMEELESGLKEVSSIKSIHDALVKRQKRAEERAAKQAAGEPVGPEEEDEVPTAQPVSAAA